MSLDYIRNQTINGIIINKKKKHENLFNNSILLFIKK